MEIKIKCKGHINLPLDSLVFFQGELKELTKDSYNKLRKQIVNHGFSEPISVWQHKDKNYILNGHQRVRVLRVLKEEKHTIPDIPCNLIEAKDIKEAKKKVLAFTSQYGKITDDGLYEFMNDADIPFEDIKDDFQFHELDLDNFEKSFFKDDSKEKEKEIDENINTDNECPKCGYKW